MKHTYDGIDLGVFTHICISSSTFPQSKKLNLAR